MTAVKYLRTAELLENGIGAKAYKIL